MVVLSKGVLELRRWRHAETLSLEVSRQCIGQLAVFLVFSQQLVLDIVEVVANNATNFGMEFGGCDAFSDALRCRWTNKYVLMIYRSTLSSTGRGQTSSMSSGEGIR